MDKYAVIQFGGKQLLVTEGQKFEIERQGSLEMDVLLFSENGNVQIGTPILKDIAVKATLLEDKKDKKIVVARYKSKSRYRKKKGHRQPISVIQIDQIGKATAKAKTEVKEEKVAPKTTTSEKKTVAKPVKTPKNTVKKASTEKKKVKKVAKKKEEKK
jgi:large subunit ribosomal protein L21